MWPFIEEWIGALMEKRYRLRNNREFKKVYNKGKNFWNRNLILYKNENKLEVSRLGITITKKFGNAVVRNRAKRRLKEIYRLYLYRIKDGYDIIIIPKKNVIDLSYEDLKSALEHILRISKLLKD